MPILEVFVFFHLFLSCFILVVLTKQKKNIPLLDSKLLVYSNCEQLALLIVDVNINYKCYSSLLYIIIIIINTVFIYAIYLVIKPFRGALHFT